MTLKVLLGIYWQALRLLIKRTPSSPIRRAARDADTPV